jgi:hypothetical protein
MSALKDGSGRNVAGTKRPASPAQSVCRQEVTESIPIDRRIHTGTAERINKTGAALCVGTVRVM